MPIMAVTGNVADMEDLRERLLGPTIVAVGGGFNRCGDNATAARYLRLTFTFGISLRGR